MPGRGVRGADMRRAVAVLLLVAVAAVGLRATGAFSAKGSGAILGMSEHALYWILAVTEVVLAIAGVVLFVARLLLMRSGAGPMPRKRRSIWWILLLPPAVYGLTKLFVLLRSRGAGPHRGLFGAAHTGGPGTSHGSPGSPWPVLVLFAVVALAAGLLTVYRRRRALPVRFSPVPEPEPLAEALAAGAQVLSEEPDPRHAIIGCYAAMERSLAEAGSPAQAADTPAEVLARATESGLVAFAPAATLTGLFRRARYSGHPVTEADRAAAMTALDEVRASLANSDPVSAP